MDNDTLIAEVFNRRPLWDQNHEDHSSRTLTDKLWDEVAAILNVPKDKARLKWRYLRGTYRNVIKKYPPPPPGSEDEVTNVPWCYYKPLMFLNGQFHTKRERMVVLDPRSRVELDVDGACSNVEMVEEEPTFIEDIDSWCGIDETSAFTSCGGHQKDDDLQFFRSLLPTIKSVSLEKKFLLKMKIQELVYQDVFSNSNGSDQPTIITLVSSSGNKSS